MPEPTEADHADKLFNIPLNPLNLPYMIRRYWDYSYETDDDATNDTNRVWSWMWHIHHFEDGKWAGAWSADSFEECIASVDHSLDRDYPNGHPRRERWVAWLAEEHRKIEAHEPPYNF